MTDRTHYCAGCKGREDIIRKLEAEVERLTLTVRKLQGNQGALEADNARLDDALRQAVIDAAEWARKAGEAQGKLEISEAAGILDGWMRDCERLRADNARLRGMLEPQWFYAGEDQSSDQCRFSIDEVLEDELCGWGPPKTGKHVVHVSTALPGPDIWVAVHVFTDEEKDARGDDETWTFEEFSTEAEARAALQETSNDCD